MESSINTSEKNQNVITNNFLEDLEICMDEIQKISKVLSVYDTNVALKNFHFEIEFEMTKLNLKFLEGILSCFEDYKYENSEKHTVKMLKLYDFILYEFKRLRSKYEEMNEFYFNLDEENKYISNIKNFMELEELKPTKIGCLYLRLLNYYLSKIHKKIKDFSDKEFKINKELMEKYTFSNGKIQFLCRTIYDYLIGNDENKINKLDSLNSNSIIKIVINEGFSIDNTTQSDSIKWSGYVKSIFNKINSKIKFDKNKANGVLSTVKNGFNSFMKMLSSDTDNSIFKDLIPDTKVIKMIFQAFESKLVSIHPKEQAKTNEIIYFSRKNLENFRILNEKEGLKRLQNGSTRNLVKFRILTNQLVKINYEYQNLYEKQTKDLKLKDINFFGLLLRVSKDFLTPSYNVILHIPGGGFFSQSSESHLSYLNEWAKKTDSVIISLDYKLTQDNKYPILFDECLKAYEILVTYSAKLFNFNINKLVIYSDSVGSLITLDIIKHAIKNNLKSPDSTVLVFPCPNIATQEMSDFKDSLVEFEDNSEISLQIKLQELLLENKDEYLKSDDRLNFFLSDDTVVSSFPPILLISSANDPIRHDCVKLHNFFKDRKVSSDLKQLVYYCHGFLQIPSLFDSQHKCIMESSLNFIQNVFKLKEVPDSDKENPRGEGGRCSLNSKTTSESFAFN